MISADSPRRRSSRTRPTPSTWPWTMWPSKRPSALMRPLEVDEHARAEPRVERGAPQRLLGQLAGEARRVGLDGGQAAAVHRDRAAEGKSAEERRRTSMRTTSTSPRRSALRTVPVPSTMPVNMAIAEGTRARRGEGGARGTGRRCRGARSGLVGCEAKRVRDLPRVGAAEGGPAPAAAQEQAARGRAPPGRRAARPGTSRAPPIRPRPSRSGGRAPQEPRAAARGETRPLAARPRAGPRRRLARGGRGPARRARW